MREATKGRNDKRVKRGKNQERGIESCFEEARRYYRNGKKTLKETKIEYGIYKDAKKVAEASAIAYLGLLKALQGFLLQRGLEKKKLPRSYEEYRKLLKQEAIHNGKLIKLLDTAYGSLHLAGYYRDITSVEMIKQGMEATKKVIEKVSGRRV